MRSIWELVGRLDLRWYHAQIAAVEGNAGREHTDPQLLISMWLSAYNCGISSARDTTSVRTEVDAGEKIAEDLAALRCA